MGAFDVSEKEHKIDPAFVLPPELRPKLREAPLASHALQPELELAEDIPLIDLAPVLSFDRHDGEDEDQYYSIQRGTIVKEIAKASEEWGFFQVINHGVSLKLLEEVEAEALKFFSQPSDEKSKIRRTLENPLGYFDTELTKNVRDWKEVFDFVTRGNIELAASDGTYILHQNRWPENQPRLKEVCEAWAAATVELGYKLLELLALSLGLPPTYFNPIFEKEDTNFIRLNYYPPCPAPDLALGVSRHKDGGALTVLVQDEVGGLEVKRKDGEWIRVRPRRDAFVINVGDLFQVWSNDRYKSVEHRVVVNEHKARFSVPLFINPSYSTTILPIPELVDEQHPAKYRPYSWGYFLQSRKNSNFKNLGVENLQISHFAINS